MFRAFIVIFLTAGSFAQIDAPTARQAFDDIHRACTADAGHTWGHTLCGPMLFVHAPTRVAVANQQDTAGILHKDGDLFVGTVGPKHILANTGFDWNGQLWSEVLWPVPQDAERRSVLLAHESFHRLQKELNIPVVTGSENEHLDTLEGRYWMRLEFRALEAALRSTGKQREQAEQDALAFRAHRGDLFHLGSKDEFALESNEGLANYTGVKVGISDPTRQIAYAARELEEDEKLPSLVRSFAYATGPAYGLLLDDAKVNWRARALKMEPAVNMLAEAVAHPARVSEAEVKQAAKRYGGDALWQEESARDAELKKKKADYRARLVDGPVLKIPFEQMHFEFDPNAVFTLDDFGNVYPHLRITDNWGVLEVTSGGGLISAQWNSVTVPAAGNRLEGEGWKLQLNEDYKLLPGSRQGDFTVGKAPAQ
jgi:hypothetical protein